jgi:hypothetical protein
MTPPDDRYPESPPLVIDVADMADDELEQLARLLLAAQDEAVRRRVDR